jgi:hypothetical protein
LKKLEKILKKAKATDDIAKKVYWMLILHKCWKIEFKKLILKL